MGKASIDRNDLLQIEGYLIILRDSYQSKAGRKLEHLTPEQAKAIKDGEAAEVTNINRLLKICDDALERG